MSSPCSRLLLLVLLSAVPSVADDACAAEASTGLDPTRKPVVAAWADAFVSSKRLPGIVVAAERDGD
eukprot:5224164-Prymnesium_polylepis.1